MLNNLIRVFLSLLVLISSIPAEAHKLSNSLITHKKGDQPTALAPTSPFQSRAVLHDVFTDPHLSKDVRETAYRMMESLGLFDTITLAYLEILLSLKIWKLDKTRDPRGFRAEIQKIFSKWAERYIAVEKARGLEKGRESSSDGLSVGRSRAIQVQEIEQIGNRIFVLISVFGKLFGLVIDPKVELKHLLPILEQLKPLDIKAFALLKRAQNILQGMIGRGRVTFSELCRGDPELWALEPVLRESPFPLLDVAPEPLPASEDDDRVTGLRDLMMDGGRSIHERIQAAAGLIKAVKESPKFRGFSKDVWRFLMLVFHRYSEVQREPILIDPLCIVPFRNLYAQLSEGSLFRDHIELELRNLQSQFIRVSDRQSIIYRVGGWDNRFESLTRYLQALLNRVRGAKGEELNLNEGLSPFRVQAFRGVWDKVPRILVDADMDLSYASALFRTFSKSDLQAEIVGADKMLYGYLIWDPLGNAFLLDGEGKLTWSHFRVDGPPAVEARSWKGLVQKADKVFLEGVESSRKSGGASRIEVEGFTVERISLMSPRAEELLEESPLFRAIERDAFSAFEESVAIRLNFNHMMSYHFRPEIGERSAVPYLRHIGLQMEEGSLFVIGSGGGKSLGYWVYQRVEDHLYLIDHSRLLDDNQWKGAMPVKIALKESPPPSGLVGMALSTLVLFQNTLHHGWNWMIEKAGLFLTSLATLLFLTAATPQESKTLPPDWPGWVQPEEDAHPSLLFWLPHYFPADEFEWGMAFNQGLDYRLHLGGDLSNAWRLDWRFVRSGLVNDTLHHETLDLIERNGAVLGLTTGYVAPLEFARAMREIPIASDLTGLWARYHSPESPFWLRLGLGMDWFELPRLEGEEYHLARRQVRPFGGFDLGLDLDFLDLSWLNWHDQLALSVYYQELIQDRMINPEGVDASGIQNRSTATFHLLNDRLRLMTSMETAFTPQAIANVYFRTWQMSEDATNDQIAREVIAWGTRYGGMMVFPFDERGVPINFGLGPDDLLDLLELRQHAGVRFRAAPVLWHTLESDVLWRPWEFLQVTVGGGLALTWRPEITFRLREMPKNFHKDYLKDEWLLGFDAIPFVRPSIWLAILRDLTLSLDFQGHWPDDLPFSHRFTARLRWHPEWLPVLIPGIQDAGIGVFYRWSNYSDRFGTVQTLSDPPLHTLGFDTKLRWAPVKMNGPLETRKMAKINPYDNEGVHSHASDHPEGGGRLGHFWNAVGMRLMKPVIRKAVEKFRERYPQVDLSQFEIFMVDSQRLGSIIHSDESDREVHLHQNLFRLDFNSGRLTLSKLWHVSDEIERRSELASFILAHEAIRHPQVDVRHEDFPRLSEEAQVPGLKDHYERFSREDQETFREMLEEEVVIYGDLVDDFLKGSEERQRAILAGLEATEPKDESGNQPFRSLLSMSRFRGESSLMQYEILPFLLKDPRFTRLLPNEFHADFVRFAMFLRNQLADTLSPNRGRSDRSTRRNLLERGFWGSLLGLTAFVLEACGVSEEVWRRHRAENVYISEDEGRTGYGVSTVEGGKVAVLANSVKAKLDTDLDSKHYRGSNAAYILNNDTSGEPDTGKHYVDLAFDFSGSPKEDNLIFPATRGLNNYELIDFEYVASGIDHLLHFIDDDNVSYLVAVKFENGDPNKLYRITIFDLVRALSINGLKVGRTTLYMRVPAGKPFIFNGWVPHPVPGPTVGVQSGTLKRGLGFVIPLLEQSA